MKTIALILAAGSGIRFGGNVPKQFRLIHNRPLLSWTVTQFEKAVKIDEIILVVAEPFLLYTGEKVVDPYSFRKVRKIVVGGATRQQSTYNGLKSLPVSTSYVAVHDGARPVIHPADIDRVVESAQKDRAAILARPVSDTIKRVEADFIISTLDRRKLYHAETPQVFQYDLLMSAFEKAGSDSGATDEASLVESLGFKVKAVIPSKPNVKVTTEENLKYAALLLEEYQ